MTVKTFKKGFFTNRPFPKGQLVDTLVVHCTAGGNLSGAEATLRAADYGYHYIIDKNGDVYKGAPTSSRVSHAGTSIGPHGAGCNAYSLGICFVNLNGQEVVKGVLKFTGKVDPYTSAQLRSFEALGRQLMAALPALRYLTGHKDISPGRKVDPWGFPTDQWAKTLGLTYWHPGK